MLQPHHAVRAHGPVRTDEIGWNKFKRAWFFFVSLFYASAEYDERKPHHPYCCRCLPCSLSPLSGSTEFDRMCLTISWLCLKSSTSNQTFYTHELLQPLVDFIFSLHWRCTPLAINRYSFKLSPSIAGLESLCRSIIKSTTLDKYRL